MAMPIVAQNSASVPHSRFILSKGFVNYLVLRSNKHRTETLSLLHIVLDKEQASAAFSEERNQIKENLKVVTVLQGIEARAKSKTFVKGAQ